MHNNYEDITSRIAEIPTWYDANGTPRYGPFKPEMCPNIYAYTVVLLRIACAGAGCRQSFDVEMHDEVFSPIRNPKNLHYGDPPRHPCEYGGDTMNCDDIAVLEVWHLDERHDWKRHPELEGLMDEVR